MNGVLASAREKFHPLYHLRRFGPARAALGAVDVPVWARVHGVSWRVRVRVVRHLSYILLPRTPEPGIVATISALQEVLRPRAFCDVGANFGYYSWLLKTSDPSVRVTLIEPDPENVSLIEATLERNRLEHAELVVAAASDAIGEAPFNADPVSGATGSLSAPSFAAAHWHTRDTHLVVPTTTLDECLIDPVDLIKIDVEGHEDAVLAGGQGVIDRDRPAIVFECFGDRDARIAWLADRDYVVFDAERAGSDPRRSDNLLALPKEREDAIEEIDRVRSVLPGT